jgi:hypothetical protein
MAYTISSKVLTTTFFEYRTSTNQYIATKLYLNAVQVEMKLGVQYTSEQKARIN